MPCLYCDTGPHVPELPNTHLGARRSPAGTAQPCLDASGHRRQHGDHLGPAWTSPGVPSALPECPHCPLTHHGDTQQGGVVVCHLRGLAAGPQKSGCLCQRRSPTQQPLPWAPNTLPTPHSQGSLAPGQHQGAAGALRGSPCAMGPCPLGGWTVRVFQVTPGTVGVSSTSTQPRGNSWPAGGSMATTWTQAMDDIGAVPCQGCAMPKLCHLGSGCATPHYGTCATLCCA